MYKSSIQLTDADRVIEKLNADMSNIWHWSQENGLSLNPQKSQAKVISSQSLQISHFSQVLLNETTVKK
jgi:hypothetical protein